ncbi:Sorting nexin-2 [Papilio machaon]|uniref:Sorting nexin-2 n=1 Tax=Papilio machaon TaxID=76193 RepID=A0A0N1IID9_PAPMA|nr:Sorting nexin-2 [Papilio machaon]
MLRLFNKVGETVNKITYRMDESDPWFEERISRVEGLETQLRRLCGACEALAGERRELAARSHAPHAQPPHSPPLTRIRLSPEHCHISQIYTRRMEQSNTDFYVLTEHIKDYLGLIGAIKDVFHERVKVFQNWQHAQMQLTKRRENKAKAELANRPEKIEQASNEIIEVMQVDQSSSSCLFI